MLRTLSPVAFSLLLTGCFPDPEAEIVNVGDRAPKFSAKLVDGGDFDFAANKGKVILLNFFGTWCAPCRIEMPELQAIWTAHKDRPDFAMIAVGRDDSNETILKYRAALGLTLPMAADPKRSAYERYAQKYVPRTFLISRDGVVAFSAKGIDATTLPKLKNELAAQLEKKK
jgi:peroxiredoxin